MYYRVSKLFLADIGRVIASENKFTLIHDLPLKKVIVRKNKNEVIPKSWDFRGNTYYYLFDCNFPDDEMIGKIMIGSELPLSYFVKESLINKDIILKLEERLAEEDKKVSRNIKKMDPVFEALMDLVVMTKTLPNGKRQIEFSRVAKLGYSYVDALLSVANGTASVSPDTVMDNALKIIEEMKREINASSRIIPFKRIRSDNNDRK